jgi:hypothetical protein
VNTRPLPRALLGIALVMTAAELVSALIIWRESYVDAEPRFAVVFALLFAGAAALLHRRRTAGAVLCGLLCSFEIGTAPAWQRYSVLDWAFQLPVMAVSLAGLALSIVVVVGRVRGRVPEHSRLV